MHHKISDPDFPVELLSEKLDPVLFKKACDNLPAISWDPLFNRISTSELYFFHLLYSIKDWQLMEMYLTSLKGESKAISQLFDLCTRTLVLLESWQPYFVDFVQRLSREEVEGWRERWHDKELRGSLLSLVIKTGDFNADIYAESLQGPYLHATLCKVINIRNERALPWLIEKVTGLPEQERADYINWYVSTKKEYRMSTLRAANIVSESSNVKYHSKDKFLEHFLAGFCAIVSSQDEVVRAYKSAKTTDSVKALMDVYGPRDPSALLGADWLSNRTKNMVLEIVSGSFNG